MEAAKPKGSYVLTGKDREKAVSPEARKRRRETIARRRADRLEAVLWLRREKQMVPAAIADYLGISDGQVRTYLRELPSRRRSDTLQAWSER